MAENFSFCARANLRTLFIPPNRRTLHFVSALAKQEQPIVPKNRRACKRRSFAIRVLNEDSYLGMWKKAVDREREEIEFQRIAENSSKDEEEEDPEALERKSDQFKKILEVPKEERDRIQRMQVIDRAAAAIAAARALLEESPPPKEDSVDSGSSGLDLLKIDSNGSMGTQKGGILGGDVFVPPSGTLGGATPGPDFWSWTPPLDSTTTSEDFSSLKPAGTAAPPNPIQSVIEKDRSLDFLPIPFESTSIESHNPPLPPFQSLVEVQKADVSDTNVELPNLGEKHEIGLPYSVNAAEAAEALNKVGEALSQGVKPDGSKWWKETGVEQRPDGVVCRWTLTRGVSADKSIEWEDKFWEAADQFGHKELGSEKSGRDTEGNVWREYWKESMWQDLGSGLIHMEKTADKWGKNGMGGQWHEKWWEHYDASGQAEKWADKWCSIDPYTPLEAGHAHVWHERWGEKYDGQGGSTKYTDKWAERLEGDGWTKWGDKWDENFNQYSQGVKQGETWWQGKYGEQWNRTWGEHHNGSGWIHKYGKSSCGEHWDTHVQQDTWYERYPHFGFHHCFENSIHLREVGKPLETEP